MACADALGLSWLGESQDAQAEGLAAIEVAAGLRAGFVKGAELGKRVETDARSVAALVHAKETLAFDGEIFGDRVTGAQLDDEMTTAAAASAQGEVGRESDKAQQVRVPEDWRPLVLGQD